ncbi:MAG: ATP-binding protein [Pirellulales bacterium]|nr:ATP-binding protein [Pirellulales bacterium]
MASLFVIQGRDQGTRFELEGKTIGLGRDASNPIQVHDTEVSRRHAELRHTPDEGIVLGDLRSSNGTFVNGRRVDRHPLHTGDRIQVGRTLLLFTDAEDNSSVRRAIEGIDIIDQPAAGNESQIIHSVSHREGSRILDPAVDASESPWLARARSNLQIMYRTALAVSHTLDIEQLVKRIMDMIFEWVEADRGCIMLTNPETQQLEPTVRKIRKGSESDTRIESSQTILDFVMEKNEGVLTTDAGEDSRWDPTGSIVRLGIREAICVPMQGRYGVVGVIYVDTSTNTKEMIRRGATNKFNEEHLKLMVAIGHQAALAVEDTSYYKAMVQAERMAAIGQTVATLSHHTKNVLQGIRGGSYLIEMGLGDFDKEIAEDETPDVEKLRRSLEAMRKGWQIVERNQNRISTLVMDMLTFSKERDPDLEPANMNDVVRDVAELMEPRAKELGVKLKWQLADEMPTLTFDPEGLHRAILNVVTNAIDACDQRDDGVVNLWPEFDRKKKMVRVIVEDNGSGIKDEDLEKIFAIFVSQKGGRGTGLGLPVSKKILNEHGGDIHVETQLDKGSRFTLELPASKPKKADKSSPAHTVAIEKPE